MKKQLRDYQQDALAAFKKWVDTPEPEALIAMTVGLGKTITASACIDYFLGLDPNNKVLWLTHREELVDQSSTELSEYTEQNCEIEKGDQHATGNGRLVVASVQSLYSKRLSRFAELFQPTLIVADESHHALAVSWMQVKQTYPNAKILNLTATPFRADIGNRLDLGVVLSEHPTSDGITRGFLVPPKPVGKLEVDLGNVKKRLGDYDASSLAELLCHPDIIKACVELVRQNFQGKRTILFAASVEHGQVVSAALRGAGFRVGEVYGTTPTAERQGYYEGIRSRTIDILVNNLCLTEGFNLPCLEAVAMFRPTRNSALYIQCIGRGLRTDPDNPDKKCCLLIDVIDTAKRPTGQARELPIIDDLRNYEVMIGRKSSLPQVFLSWFYRHTDVMDVILKKKQLHECEKLGSSKALYNLLVPAWMVKLRGDDGGSDVFNPIWSADSDYKHVFRPFRIAGADAFCLFAARKGWVYLPHNKLPQTPEQFEEEVGDIVGDDQESNFTLEIMLGQDAKLKNFIIDLFDANQSLTEQANKYYDVYQVCGQPIAWFKVLHEIPAEFHFVQWNDTSKNKFLIARTPNGDCYFYACMVGAKWTHLPNSEVKLSQLPAYVRGTGWEKKKMSPGQSPHVAKILRVPEAELAKFNISSLSASVLMSNNWSRKQLDDIAAALHAKKPTLAPLRWVDDQTSTLRPLATDLFAPVDHEPPKVKEWTAFGTPTPSILKP